MCRSEFFSFISHPGQGTETALEVCYIKQWKLFAVQLFDELLIAVQFWASVSHIDESHWVLDAVSKATNVKNGHQENTPRISFQDLFLSPKEETCRDNVLEISTIKTMLLRMLIVICDVVVTFSSLSHDFLVFTTIREERCWKWSRTKVARQVQALLTFQSNLTSNQVWLRRIPYIERHRLLSALYE